MYLYCAFIILHIYSVLLTSINQIHPAFLLLHLGFCRMTCINQFCVSYKTAILLLALCFLFCFSSPQLCTYFIRVGEQGNVSRAAAYQMHCKTKSNFASCFFIPQLLPKMNAGFLPNVLGF